MKENHVHQVRRRLLRWYRENARNLPWRAGPSQAPALRSAKARCNAQGGSTIAGAEDGPARGAARANPYWVLVSEAMLQQTQVATVVDYFERFIKAFATVKKLAAADEQRVLRLWQGLGYYRRARHLHQAAKMIVDEYGGQVPGTVEQLLTLPGVGRYTAGAIASIAFGVRAPILDGNVARVLCRMTAIKSPVDQPTTQRQLWALAQDLVPPGNPGDFNQAMMELGALICTPRQPRCESCPVGSHCRARTLDIVDTLPVRGKPAKVMKVTHRIAAIRRGNKLLFEQRPADGLWAGMWQMPTAEDVSARQTRAWFGTHTNLALEQWRRVDTFIHQTTHRTIKFELWLAHAAGGRLRRGAGQWRGLNNLDDLPMANPQRKAVKLIRDAT